MKRIEFEEQGFRVVTYNPGGGWIAHIHPKNTMQTIVSITGLKDKQDAFLKIGCEIGYLILNEVDPNKSFEEKTKWVNYE